VVAQLVSSNLIQHSLQYGLEAFALPDRLSFFLGVGPAVPVLSMEEAQSHAQHFINISNIRTT
jgi:hypothetical protein